MKEPTSKQKVILQKLTDGQSLKEIAYEMGRNAGTIKTAMIRARERLGARTTAQAVAIALHFGWVKVELQSRRGRRS